MAAVILLLPWASAAAFADAGPRQPLRFVRATFDPLADPLPEGALLRTLASAGPFLVQFPYPMTGSEAPLVEAAGGQVVGYVADGGLVVVGPAGLGASLRHLTGVRWVGLVPPALRLRPDAEGAPALTLQYGGPPAALEAELAVEGARAFVFGPTFAIVTPGPGGARAVAGLPHVLWVEPYAAPEGANYRATITDKVRQVTNASTYSTGAGALWAFNPDPVNPGFIGYTGKGVTVDVTDQGVDGNHTAFAGRKGAAKSWTATPVWVDFDGHGTHVAATALGSGGYLPQDTGAPFGLYAGAAPGAALVAQTYNPAGPDYAGMAEFAASSGASISVNSWGESSAGSAGNYTAVASAYDAATIDASAAPGTQPLLFVFSAGNGDNAPGSVSSPGTAKNVITVGATGNDYAPSATSDDVMPYSSFGPTADNRVKPDLVAPGDFVASANSTERTRPLSGPLPPAAGASYVYLSGTSQAAPQVAGAAAVATQFLQETRGRTATPALLKALLINGAKPLPGYPWPGPAQGWGRLDLASALLNTSGRRVDFVPEGFETLRARFDTAQYNVSLDAGQELRVTLVWSDPANTAMASPALWNDLDLEVRDANDSVIYRGNDINASAGYSVPSAGGHYDSVNNVEVVRIPNAAAGVWKIFVRADSLGKAPQTFALAFSGAINRSYADLAVQSPTIRGAPQSLESGDSVTLDGEVTNDGGSTATNITVFAVPSGDPLAPPYAVYTIASLGPGERVSFSLTFVPPDGANTIAVKVASIGPDADPANNLATVAFFVLRRQPQLSGATDAVALPGDPAVFSLTARNGGNVADTLTLAEDPGVRDPAWLLTFSRTQFTLAPGASAAFQVFVQVPAGAAEADQTLAEVRLISSGNTSRSDFLSITAHAGGLHLISLQPAGYAVTSAPNATTEVPVRIANIGNAVEAITVTLTPTWADASAWSGSTAVLSLAPGASADLRLNLSNSDWLQAGYRGSLRIRAVIASTGAAFDSELPLFVEARPCLAFDAVGALASMEGSPTNFTLTLRNCGNAALSGPLLAQAPTGLTIEAPTSFALAPQAFEELQLGVLAADGMADSDLEAVIRADASQGTSAVVSLTIHHASSVRLVPIRTLAMPLKEGPNRLAFTLHNAGGAGAVMAPAIVGAPAGWSFVVLPAIQQVASDTDASFTALVDGGSAATASSAQVTLRFYPGSAREGELELKVLAFKLAAPPQAAPRASAALWPSTLTPAFAVALGMGAAALAALAMAPSRSLLRSCPACGQPAPRFDTFMNPRCAQCGESLRRSAHTRGEPR